MAQFSLLILNNCPLQSFSSCFSWWNKGLAEVVTFAQCCYTLSMGSIRIGQRTNYPHLGVPLLPSHQMIVIHNMSMTHGPRSYPSVATQVPLSLHFIQPWLWHSKSHRILLGLWRAFYLKSSWDHWLISWLSATEELSSFCTSLKPQVSWSCTFCLLQISWTTWQAKPLQEIKERLLFHL